MLPLVSCDCSMSCSIPDGHRGDLCGALSEHEYHYQASSEVSQDGACYERTALQDDKFN